MFRLRIALAAGFVALTAFLIALEVLFVRESEEARAQLEGHARALEQFASTTLIRSFDDELNVALARIDELNLNPLMDERGVILLRSDVQLFPRVTAAKDLGLRERARQLAGSAQAADGDSPYAERLGLHARLVTALGKNDRAGIEAAVRETLKHRTRWVLPPEEDLPLIIASLQALAAKANPSPELFRMVLREGFRAESRSEGLQVQVLRAWPRLGPDDARFLCDAVRALSERAQVERDDFVQACDQGLAPREAAHYPDSAAATVRLARDGWVVLTRSDETRGVELDVQQSLTHLDEQMRERGLLEGKDRLLLTAGAEVPLKSVTVSLDSPRFRRADEVRRENLRIKTALIILTFLLGAGIVAFAVTAQSRRARYLELQSDFVSTVSHELRTPLASMRVMAETLERKLAGHAPAKDYPSRLVQTVDSLAFLVENILSFNRIDKGRWAPKRERWSFASLEALLRDDASHAPVQVELELEGLETAPVLEADPELMRILFLNLLRNAWKYAARAPVKVRFAVAGAAVRVTDNGIGIPREQWERIFDAFHRVKDGRAPARGGSGLGLALCRRIAALHGGTVRVEQSSDEGTTMLVTLGEGQVR